MALLGMPSQPQQSLEQPRATDAARSGEKKWVLGVRTGGDQPTPATFQFGLYAGLSREHDRGGVPMSPSE
jgi:hypothetical protein